MSVRTMLVRRSRCDDQPGCPLAALPGGAEDEAACERCPHNWIAPGSARVGCVIDVRADDLSRALERLHRISPKDHARLTAILESERKRADTDALSRPEVEEILAIVKRWAALASNEAGERQVVAVALKFADGAIQRGEPVRILA